MSNILPRQAVPELKVATLQGEDFDLYAQLPQHLQMLVFYRGYHCPICKMYIQDLDKKLERFKQLGVEVIAISSNDQSLAKASQEEWGLQNVNLGYGLSLDEARKWGLYISNGYEDMKEPKQFSEPGLFLVKPDKTLYAASIQSMPFSRPNFQELLAALDFVIKNDYPARGEQA